MCQSKAGKRELAEFVKTFYEKTLPSKPEIRFPFKETKQFYGYLETALKILPSEYWRINICKYTPTTIVNEVTGENLLPCRLIRKKRDTLSKNLMKNSLTSKGILPKNRFIVGLASV